MKRIFIISLIGISTLIYGVNKNKRSKRRVVAKIKSQTVKKENTGENFQKTLQLQGVQFNISTEKRKDGTRVNIRTKGLKEVEYNEYEDIGNYKVLNAEVKDIDLDGSPELFIYTQSADMQKYGNVLVFSVNNKKSMSGVYFPDIKEDNTINKGYNGQDKFSFLKNKLCRTFPIYSENKLTGKHKKVCYRLENGEASKILNVNSQIVVD